VWNLDPREVSICILPGWGVKAVAKERTKKEQYKGGRKE
jgi:hypothetical protein